MASREDGRNNDALKRQLDCAPITTRPPSEAYREGWDRIFNKIVTVDTGEPCPFCGQPIALDDVHIHNANLHCDEPAYSGRIVGLKE